jgi:plasmid stability protein
MLALLPEVNEMAAVSIRNLDETVRERLRMRAAAHGRSMEAEMRAILMAAVEEPGDNTNVVESLVYGFVALGGVDLNLPPRSDPARAADFGL